MLSIIFYKERTVFTDIAFHIFHLVVDEDFAIQNNRFGAIVTQIFPLSAIKAGASLTTIMIVYSIGFVIFYFIVFILCYSIKAYKYALLMLLLPLLTGAHTFYWIQSEMMQGLAFIIFLFGFYGAFKNKIISNNFLLLFVTVLVVFSAGFHPLSVIPFLFLVAFIFLDERVSKAEIIFMCVWVTVSIATQIYKSIIFPTSNYEELAFEGAKNIPDMFPHYLFLASNKQFALNCLKLYYFLMLLFLITIIYYYKKKSFKKLVLLLVFFGGYLFLINTSYPNGATDFYMENLYLPLSIFVLVPFIFDVMPQYPIKKQNLIIIIIAAVGLIRIYLTHVPYTNRYTWEENFIKENADRKLFVDANAVPIDTLIDIWASPYESWLLSTSQFGKTASIFISHGIDKFFEYPPENRTLFLTFDTYPYSELPKKYFNLTDTSRYVIITAD